MTTHTSSKPPRGILDLSAVSRDDLLYMAGLFDGEGSVFVITKDSAGRWPSHRLGVGLSMVDEGIIDWVHERFSGQRSLRAKHTSNNRQVYEWRQWDKKAATMLEALLPFLKIKQLPTELGLQLQATKGPGRPKGTPEELKRLWDYRLSLKTCISDINHGRPANPPLPFALT